jgi:hypothetical protein
MRTIIRWFRLHLVASLAVLASTVFGAIGGAALTDFASWRTENREFLRSQVEATKGSDEELINILRKFSDKALGRATTTDEDLRTLKASVSKSYHVAASLSARLPAVKSDFDQYADALTTLQKSAEKLTGPADGKPFVEAVSAFADRRQAFQQRVALIQNRWPL